MCLRFSDNAIVTMKIFVIFPASCVAAKVKWQKTHVHSYENKTWEKYEYQMSLICWQKWPIFTHDRLFRLFCGCWLWPFAGFPIMKKSCYASVQKRRTVEYSPKRWKIPTFLFPKRSCQYMTLIQLELMTSTLIYLEFLEIFYACIGKCSTVY